MRSAMATPSRTLLAMTISLMAAPPVLCETTRLDEASLPVGSYAITTRLELPHLERWAIDKTTTICLSDVAAPRQLPDRDGVRARAGTRLVPLWRDRGATKPED